MQLCQHFIEVVDPIVDREGRVTRAEPLTVFIREMPHSEILAFGLVVRPFEYGAAEVFQLQSQVLLLIARSQRGALALAL